MSSAIKSIMNFPLICLCLSFTVAIAESPVFDIVITGGRVMDPETNFDGIRSVGINGDRIVEISSNKLQGKRTIKASGFIVGPGFIDLHAHGQTNDAHRYQVRDGVTTALELESGVTFLREWLASKTGKTIVNFGGTAPHGSLRVMAMSAYEQQAQKMQKLVEKEGLDSPKVKSLRSSETHIDFSKANYRSLSQSEITKTNQLMDNYLEAGALGIGVPVGYYSGATAGEIFSVYQFAASRKVPIYSHTRGFGLAGIQEAIANASASRASLHVVHANSLSLGEIQTTLSIISDAQKNGLDITTEVYPYSAASTSLESQIFDEGWQKMLNISYKDLQWVATGERLTKKTFHSYRKEGGTVIIHMMKPEWINTGVSHPITMIASDGMPYAPAAHPRTAGTFSRVLGKYAREQQSLDLMTALKKMTIMPANRLAATAPTMNNKGRLQVGMDADITIFDPETVVDKADFNGLKHSEGIEYVLINGTIVVDKGENVENVFPGRPILGKYRR